MLDDETADEAEQRRAWSAQGMAVAWWAQRHPDAPAILSPHGDRTWGELDARANQLVRLLRARGLGEGDAVALMSRNRPEWVEVYAASLRGGWRLTPVNWHLTGPEAAYIVTDCEARAVVLDASLPAVADGAITLDDPEVVRLSVAGAIDGYEDLGAACEGLASEAIDDPRPGSTMLYTSGTTGRPKGVHRDQPRALRPVDEGGYVEGDVHLCTGPLYHGGPLAVSLHPPLTLGVPIVLMDRWDAEDTLRLVDRHRVTHTHMVPTMFHRILALPEGTRARYDLSSLKAVWHGAAPCPVSVKRAIIEWWGPVVHEYYSSTEGLGCTVDSATWLAHPGTVGRPRPDDQVVVGDQDGHPLPAGEVGLLWIKAPARHRFRYFKDTDKTAGAYRADHFTLGDIGYKDEDGYLYLTDRSANLIISGGVNIYPAEIDAVLLDHPAVGDAATIGVPDEDWGESVKAVVELRDGVEAGDDLAAELIAFCRERLASFKCPRSVDFVDRLPRSESGKVYKRRLRDQYRAAAAS